MINTEKILKNRPNHRKFPLRLRTKHVQGLRSAADAAVKIPARHRAGPHRWFSPSPLGAAVALAFCVPLHTSAETKVWIGGAPCGNCWSAGAQWSPSGTPATGDDVVLTTAASPNTLYDLATSVQLRSITFTSQFQNSGIGIVTVAGQPIHFQGGASITDDSAASGNGVGASVLNGPLTVTLNPVGLTRIERALSVVNLSGTGGLTLVNNVQDDNAFVSLEGNNTYSGATIISGPGLVHLNSNSSASIPTGSAVTVNGATVVFFRAATIGSLAGSGIVTMSSPSPNVNDALTVGGDNTNTTFSGIYQNGNSAVLVKVGTGTLTLLGANTYSGGTTVTGGTLVGNATSLQGNIENNAAVVFDQLANGTYSGILSGNGTLAKINEGTLTLTGANTYSGPTAVNGGTLAVNGSISSPVTVNAGGTLGGTSTINNSIAVMSGGVLAPGSSIGTLTVSGSLTFNAGSIYRVEVDAAGNADRTNVTFTPGTATISGGTVDVRAGAGNFRAISRYTILNAAGGVIGVFANVTFEPRVSYALAFLRLERRVSHARAQRRELPECRCDAEPTGGCHSVAGEHPRGIGRS